MQMTEKKKVLTGLECCINSTFDPCPYHCPYYAECMNQIEIVPLLADSVKLLKEQEDEIKALRLLVEWAEECDFGFDQFPDEYERYKDEVKGMKYIDGMIHVAKRTLQEAERR